MTSSVYAYNPVALLSASKLRTIRRVDPASQSVPAHLPRVCSTPPNNTRAVTLSGICPSFGSVTSAASRTTGWAWLLLYSSVGTLALPIVCTAGSGCTRRRSPHSNAAAEPALAVRQRSRSTVTPGLTDATTTPGALSGVTSRSTMPLSRTAEFVLKAATSFSVPAFPAVALAVT